MWRLQNNEGNTVFIFIYLSLATNVHPSILYGALCAFNPMQKLNIQCRVGNSLFRSHPSFKKSDYVQIKQLNVSFIFMEPSFTWLNSRIKNVLKILWKHYCLINLKTYECIKTTFWTMTTNCFTIFLHRNIRRKEHSKLWVSYSPTAM